MSAPVAGAPAPAAPVRCARIPSLPAGYALGLVASALFGLAIVPRNGRYDPAALALVVAGLLVLVLLVLEQRRRRALRLSGRAMAMLLVAVWVSLAAMVWAARGDVWLLVSVAAPWDLSRPELTLALLLLCSYLPALLAPWLSEPRGWRHARFGLLACTVLVGGWHVVQASPHPAIDVWELQQSGAAALTQGHNPYLEVATPDTGPSRGNVVPYAYPPMQLYATLPAFVLGGDVRYATVVAVVLAGVTLRLLTLRVARLPALAEDAPALFLWLTPKLFLILEQAWVDPVGLALLCLALHAHVVRRPKLAALVFGLALGSKQTMVWLIPLVGLLLRWSLRQWCTALGATVATILPFLLWDWAALFRANVTFVNGLPARSDALTLLNWYFRNGGSPPSAWPGVLAAGGVVSWAVWRLPRSLSACTAAAALTYGSFFALNKIAFANYYFFVLGLAALAAAAALHSAPEAPPPRR